MKPLQQSFYMVLFISYDFTKNVLTGHNNERKG